MGAAVIAPTVSCSRAVGDGTCGIGCRQWRWCPFPGCGHEIARCAEHARSLSAAGARLHEIAQAVGVAKGTVWHVLKGRTWRESWS